MYLIYKYTLDLFTFKAKGEYRYATELYIVLWRIEKGSPLALFPFLLSELFWCPLIFLAVEFQYVLKSIKK